MRLSIEKIIDHSSLLLFYLPEQGIPQAAMILPGAGCTIGCCCTSCGALTQ